MKFRHRPPANRKHLRLSLTITDVTESCQTCRALELACALWGDLFLAAARNSLAATKSSQFTQFLCAQLAMLSFNGREENVNKRAFFSEVEKYKQTIGFGLRVTPDALKCCQTFSWILISTQFIGRRHVFHLQLSQEQILTERKRIRNYFVDVSFAIMQARLQRMSFESGSVSMSHDFMMRLLSHWKVARDRIDRFAQ